MKEWNEKLRMFVKKQSPMTWTAICLVIIFLYSIFPVVYISRYNAPSADDYAGAQQMYDAVKSSSSIFAAAWDHMVTDYNSLQGTFTAGFFGAFCPIAFHPLAYFLVPLFLITALCLSVLYCLWQVLVRFLKFSVSSMVCVYVFVITALIQYLPSAVEGFYWWSGGFLYTGLFSLALVAVGTAVDCISASSKKEKIIVPITAFLLFLTGGGNFPTALVTTVIMVYLLGYIIVSRKKKKIVFGILTTASVAGLLVNVLAPSNLARLNREYGQEIYQSTISKTIEVSFRLGFQFLRTWTSLPIVLLIAMSIPFLYFGLGKCKFKFRYPIVFFVLSLCAYCAMFAPTAHSYGWIGPDRYMNVVYFGYIFFAFGNVTYIVGWTRRNIQELCQEHEIDEQALVEQFGKKHAKQILALAGCGAIWFVVCTTANFYVTDTISYNMYYSTSQIAKQELKDYAAQRYYQTYRARLDQLQDETQKDVVLDTYPIKPQTLYFDDITTDVQDWRNQLMMQYYNKNSIVLKQTQES